MDIRNRVKEYRIVAPDELAPNPLNWRSHPAAQRDALRGVLAEIGIAGALLAYYSERNGGKLTLVDGHERATVDTPWPCLILDVDDAEADTLLATHDPIGALARPMGQQLDALLRGVSTSNPALQQLLDKQAKVAGLLKGPLGLVGGAEGEGIDADAETAGLLPSYIRMVQLFLTADTQPEFAAMVQRLMPLLKTTNPTDTVMEALRYVDRALSENDPADEQTA